MAWLDALTGRLRRNRTDSAPDYRHQLAEACASRRTIVEAYEIERRRIERDLHDGCQQYLVAAVMKLGEAELADSVHDDPAVAHLLAEAHHNLNQGLVALRETVHGIHPQILSDRGLVEAVIDIARRYGDHVTVMCPNPLPPLPEGVLAVGYFFTAEALANAAKYAPGADVTVLITVGDELRISVMDSGGGGAGLMPHHGLDGMRARLSAFGGTLTVISPAGGPTKVTASMPLLLKSGQFSVVVNDMPTQPAHDGPTR